MGHDVPAARATVAEVVEAMPFGRVHVLLLLANMLLFIGNGASNEVLLWVFPSLMVEMDAPANAVGGTFALQLAGFVVSSALCTFLEALAGRRCLLAGFLCVSLSGIVLQATAGGLSTILVGRLLAGFGSGATYCVGMAYLVEFLPIRNRGKLLSLPHLGYSIGALLSLAFSSFLPSWRVAVALTTVPHGLYLLLSLWLLPESPRYLHVADRRRSSWETARWMLEVNQQPVPPWIARVIDDASDSSRAEPASGDGGVGLASYSWEQLWHQDVVRKASAIGSVWICLAFASQMMHAWLPYYLRQVASGHHEVSVETDQALRMPFVNIAVCQIADGAGIVLAAVLQDAVGCRGPLRCGLLTAALATAACLRCGPEFATAFGALQQGAQASCWACIGSLSTMAFPTVIRQSMIGLLRTIEAMGMTAGPSVGGVLVSSDGSGINVVLSYAAVVYLCGFVLAWTLGPSEDLVHESLKDSLGQQPIGIRQGWQDYESTKSFDCIARDSA